MLFTSPGSQSCSHPLPLPISLIPQPALSDPLRQSPRRSTAGLGVCKPSPRHPGRTMRGEGGGAASERKTTSKRFCASSNMHEPEHASRCPRAAACPSAVPHQIAGLPCKGLGPDETPQWGSVCPGACRLLSMARDHSARISRAGHRRALPPHCPLASGAHRPRWPEVLYPGPSVVLHRAWPPATAPNGTAPGRGSISHKDPLVDSLTLPARPLPRKTSSRPGR